MIVLCVVYRAEPILKALLSKTDLTLDNALEQAQRMEAAAKNFEGLIACYISAVLNMSSSCSMQGSAKPCGRRNHGSHECKFKSAECQKCGKVGRIALYAYLNLAVIIG